MVSQCSNANQWLLYVWLASNAEAEDRMTAYLIMQITVTNEEQWCEYREAVVPLITKGVETLEG